MVTTARSGEPCVIEGRPEELESADGDGADDAAPSAIIGIAVEADFGSTDGT